ncbi:hypothetical protein GCM10012279_27870 [Micromonospora yangpuensis]|nr:hypothetical protein GCM10012279_27870 [Micromonospora yangpuensis]
MVAATAASTTRIQSCRNRRPADLHQWRICSVLFPLRPVPPGVDHRAGRFGARHYPRTVAGQTAADGGWFDADLGFRLDVGGVTPVVAAPSTRVVIDRTGPGTQISGR